MPELPFHPDAAAALRDGDDAVVHAWFQEVLREGANPNLALADGLLLEERFYLGPFPLELSLLVRCCGPEPGIEWHDPSANWQRHVDQLAALIADGFRMPLLADCMQLRLMDGNHRAAAAAQAGLERYPVIVMFGSSAQRASWVERYLSGHLPEPLSGGHVTDVIRIGGTVRRVTKQHSAFVWELLAELAQAGFGGAPRFLGVDGAGREALGFIDGAVSPRGSHNLDQVHSVSALLRQLHDLTASSPLSGDAEVVVHGDPKPRNSVFAGDRALAFIDFDNARPGTRAEDVGYLAWQFALNSYLPPEQSGWQRDALAAVADGYRLTRAERGGLLSWAEESQARTIRHARHQEVRAWAERDRQWLMRERPRLEL